MLNIDSNFSLYTFIASFAKKELHVIHNGILKCKPYEVYSILADQSF